MKFQEKDYTVYTIKELQKEEVEFPFSEDDDVVYPTLIAIPREEFTLLEADYTSDSMVISRADYEYFVNDEKEVLAAIVDESESYQCSKLTVDSAELSAHGLDEQYVYFESIIVTSLISQGSQVDPSFI